MNDVVQTACMFYTLSFKPAACSTEAACLEAVATWYDDRREPETPATMTCGACVHSHFAAFSTTPATLLPGVVTTVAIPEKPPPVQRNTFDRAVT